MPFDTQKFIDAKFRHRTKDITVSGVLASFFDEDEKPIFKIRNLTADELSKCENEAKNNRDLQKIAQHLLNKNPEIVANGIKSIFEVDDKTSSYVVKCFGYIEFGVVEPKCDLEFAKKLGTIAPSTFFDLSSEIYQLTGLGAELGE